MLRDAVAHRRRGIRSFLDLVSNGHQCKDADDDQAQLAASDHMATPTLVFFPLYAVPVGGGCLVVYHYNGRFSFQIGSMAGLCAVPVAAFTDALTMRVKNRRTVRSMELDLIHKLLTSNNYCNTLIGIANVLPKDKQVALNRVHDGIHRDTIMRLGVRVGSGLRTALGFQDSSMRSGDSSAKKSGM